MGLYFRILCSHGLAALMELHFRKLVVEFIKTFFFSPASKPKPVKIQKRTSKLSAQEMLEKKNERKANFKELELEQGKKEFEFEEQKYEAAERLGETPTGD